MKKDTKYISTLNTLLSSYQIHYQNLRSLHWNIKGTHFFELHSKYEELYLRTQEIVDELAERILSIGGVPTSQFSSYLNQSIVPEIARTTDGQKGVKSIFKHQQKLLKLEHLLLQQSEQENDEGTNSLMSDLIREKEKSNWMFKSWLNQ